MYWVDVFQNGAMPDVKQMYQEADAIVDMPGNLFWEEKHLDFTRGWLVLGSWLTRSGPLLVREMPRG